MAEVLSIYHLFVFDSPPMEELQSGCVVNDISLNFSYLHRWFIQVSLYCSNKYWGSTDPDTDPKIQTHTDLGYRPTLTPSTDPH